MSSTISVSIRSLVVTIALVVGVVAAYALGTATRDGATAQAANSAATAERTITMTGSGDATGVPDQMSFKLSVGNTAADVSTAMDRSSRTMADVIAALKDHGVAKKDTETTGLAIDPQYRYYENQPPVITGYRVRQTIKVVVRSLRGSGKAVSAAIAAGGNSSRISGLSLKIGDVDGLLARARDRAVAEATTKAKQYAAATDQDLGEVVTLREVRADLARAMDDRTCLGGHREGVVAGVGVDDD
ncbi:MAG: SIMPL domain-containing protein, partial [Marmoricola sp.]